MGWCYMAEMLTMPPRRIIMNLRFILWETLPNDKYYITEHQYIEKGFHTISFQRDNNYRLICKLEGQEGLQSLDAFPGNDLKAGQFIDFCGVIHAQDRMNHYKVEIDNLFITNKNIDSDGLYTAEGKVNNLKIYYKTDEKPEHIIYWFLNGEKYPNFAYSRTTIIKSICEAVIEISGFSKNKIKGDKSSSFSRNSILLTLNGKQFVFGFVSEKDTQNFPGSYMRFNKDFFPTKGELKTIQYALSFIIGKILIPIGFTKYNGSFSPLERVYKSSHRHDMDHVISVAGKPPIPINMGTVMVSKENLEGKISCLLSKYHEYRSIFQLDQIVWYINLSRLLPLDTQLQPLSTALDIFQKAWFQSEKSTSKGKHLKDDSYDKIISKYIKNIKIDLGEKETTNSILNKIKASNNMGDNERYKTLFKEIKLDLAEVEEISIKERNKAIHGSLKPKNYQKISNRTNAYYSLLNRLILKLLEYDGIYIDYSTYGFPSRNINEPLRGPENDGKI